MGRTIGSAVISTLLLGLLAGCVPPAEVPGVRAELEASEFSKTLDVIGPMMIHNPFFGVKDNYRLVTLIDRQTHAVTHVIEIEIDHAGDFFNFRFAADDTSETLFLVPIKRERNRSIDNRTELVNVIVPDAALRAHAASGYRVRLSAWDGTYYDIAITPAMIAAQFAEIDKVLGPRAAWTDGLPPGGPGGSPPGGHSGSVANAPPASTRPTLGISYLPASASKFNYTFPDGLFIVVVTPNSPAAVAGVKPGDILISFDGQPLPDPAAARGIIDNAKPGSVVKLEIQRGNDRMKLAVHM
ncbi:MAG TPA: PDZ domain-containing protein [Stellaceae bacterium]|nr:PDZ domain-containing protein [Stellaceae bacterium]